MKEITFTPSNFDAGAVYNARLVKDNVIIDTIPNLVENTPYSFDVVVPGTYIVSVFKQGDNTCIFNQTVQSLFPVVTYTESAIDCSNNTYVFDITLTNPSTAGANVQYGWSFVNDCSTVNNWSLNNEIITPADDVIRYFFVKNSSQACCSPIASSVFSPCVTCNLNVTGISFICN